MKRPATVLAFGLCLLSLGAGCRDGVGRDGRSLTLAVRADVTGIFPNPPLANEAYSIHINRAIFEGLVAFDRRLALTPALAEYWENPDETTTLFVLRQGLRFSDGRPLTARDVVASLLAPRTRRWINRDYLQAIESARALDARRLEIKTRTPYHILPFKLPFGFVLPADLIAQDSVPPVGTGPYRLRYWTPGREVHLERNPFYRGSPPYFARVRLLVEPSARARINMVQRGEALLADSLAPEDAEPLASDSNLRLIARPSVRVLFLGLRVDEPPFSDPRVREAVDLALDRTELIERALGGRPEAANQLVPRAVVGFNPRIPEARPDLKRARSLLTQAGFPRGFAIRLDGPHNRYINDRGILIEVARQLERVGIQVTVNALDKREFFALQGTRDCKFFLLGWACESGEAGDALDTLVHSPAGATLGSENGFGLADAELDRLIDTANGSASRAERTTYLQSALYRVAELRPLLPLVVQTEAFLVSRRLKWDPPVSLALDVANMAEE